jgi:hypothetical protein
MLAFEHTDGGSPMVILKTATLLAALSLPLLVCTCGTDEIASPVSYPEFPAYAVTLQVQDSIGPGEMILATVAGYAGCGCVHFNRIESELLGDKWVLRPISRYEPGPPGSLCLAGCWRFGTTIALEPYDTGWVYVEVRSYGPTLLDSTYVRPE